ncbi:MAG: mechanosensitive ion channel family protein, partial [Pseudomonadota bacterium]|nr:mechanosensitive ion channel family protein [Pseudomonadota bacterium]
MEAELQQFQQIYVQVTTFLVEYSFQILGALIILALGYVVARRVGMLVESFMVRHHVDVTLSRFTGAGIKVLLIVMVVIIAMGKVGISVTPFVAAVGALSLGAGLALQGLLSNYSSGISIIVTRPFVVGDTITVQGVTGVVQSVQLGNTLLTNEDGVQISIPNKYIVGEVIQNSFTYSIVESGVPISYRSDPMQAIALIRQALGNVQGIDPARVPQVGIDGFGTNGFTLGIRFWARTEHLFQARYHA